MIKVLQVNVDYVVIFFVGFVSMLVGAKIVIALVVDKSRNFILSKIL